MLVHPWDAARDDDEWRDVLRGQDFGQLVAAGRGRDVPVVVPTHFVHSTGADGADTVLVHLARPNPVWPALAENPRALLCVVADWAFVPSAWNAPPGTDRRDGIPTSYYAAVQLDCRAEVLDDPADTAVLLERQLAAFQPGVEHAEVRADGGVHARRLPAIRGLRLTVLGVTAKLKYGGNRSHEHRLLIADRLAERDGPGDAAARRHLLRRDTAAGAGPSSAP